MTPDHFGTPTVCIMALCLKHLASLAKMHLMLSVIMLRVAVLCVMAPKQLFIIT